VIIDDVDPNCQHARCKHVTYVLQCVTVCCSVLQCVSVLRRITVCGSVL